MCLYPKLILNRKYIPNKKNKGQPAIVTDERTRYVPIGCGKCMECMRQRSREWQVRLHEELRTDDKTMKLFVTLSFSDESLIKLEKDLNSNLDGYNLDNKIATLAVRRFLERWRKTYKASLKHWLVTELGQTNTERIHIHGILWSGHSDREPTVHMQRDFIAQLNKYWQYGNIWVGDYVNERTINYIVKYLHKADPKHQNYVPIVLCSKGLGKNYINRYDSKNNVYAEKNTNELYTTRNGIKLPLPKYYRNKIYTDEQKEMLWINLLNKETRYVNGIKIDVSENESDYWNVVIEQRKENKRLGYGDDEKDWKKINYEKQLRNIKRLQRLKNSG